MSKPFARLNRADLAGAPIWTWLDDEAAAADGADESFVHPTPLAALPTPEFAQFVVAASIELKHGAPLPGIAEVTISKGEVVVQPVVVFLLDRQLQIPAVETNRLLARFTKTAENHPIGWQLAVTVEREARPRTGQIKGGDMQAVVRAGLEALLALKSLRK